MKILIVDDDKSTLMLCAAIFREHDTYQISDARQALLAFKEIQPDIVILDCRMPYIDGFEISKQIQMLDGSCRIIMMTAAIFETVNYNDYCDVFFLKPIIPRQLKEAAENLVAI